EHHGIMSGAISPARRIRPLHTLTLALCTLAMVGCGVNRQLARQADRIVLEQQDLSLTCTRNDHCAIDTPLRRLVVDARHASTPQQPIHYVNVLEQGEDSLLLRVHLIRAARKSIDMQTFIWTNDDAGRLILDELLAAARRGVRVRVLADQLFSLEDTVLLSRLALVHRNFEVRIYNPTFHKAVTK